MALGRSSSMLKWSALRSPKSTRWPLSVVRDRELFGMAEQVQRKLAAIFAADVEGYSRLMGIDEVGTLRTLTNRSTPMADGENGVSNGRSARRPQRDEAGQAYRSRTRLDRAKAPAWLRVTSERPAERLRDPSPNRSTPMADGENGVSGVTIGLVPPSPVWRSSREMPNCRPFCRAGRRTPQTRDCLAVGTVSSELLSKAAREYFPPIKGGLKVL